MDLLRDVYKSGKRITMVDILHFLKKKYNHGAVYVKEHRKEYSLTRQYCWNNGSICTTDDDGQNPSEFSYIQLASELSYINLSSGNPSNSNPTNDNPTGCNQDRSIPTSACVMPFRNYTILLYNVEPDEYHKDIYVVLAIIMENIDNRNTVVNTRKNRYSLINDISCRITKPLNNILNTVPTLSISGNDDPEVHRQIECIHRSALELAGTVTDLVDIVRIETGNLRIRKEIFPIRDAIKKIISILSSGFKSRGNKVSFYIDGSTPEYIFADSMRLQQVLINMLKNANSNTNRGDINIFIRAELIASGDIPRYEIRFDISDTGAGIAESDQKHIFDSIIDDVLSSGQSREYSSQQQHSSQTRSLGLAVSKQIIELLGGNLWLNKSECSVGTTFSFTILATEEEYPEYLDKKTIRTLKGRTILLVHDDRKILDALLGILEKWGIICVETTSIEEALILYALRRIDLIIIESHEDNDSEHIDALRKVTGAPIVFIAKNIDSLCERYIDLKADFVHIPVDEQELLPVICDIFRQSQKSYKPCHDLHILIVDNNVDSRAILTQMLEKLGYKNITATHNEQEALNIIVKDMKYFDVLIMDIKSMTTGGEFCKSIEKIFREENIPIPYRIGLAMRTSTRLAKLHDEIIYLPLDSSNLHKVLLKLRSYDR